MPGILDSHTSNT